MATITYLINAIDNASRKLNDVANSATRLQGAMASAERTVQNLNDTLVVTDIAAGRAASALNDVAAAAGRAATAQNANAAATARGGAAAAFAYGGWYRLWGLIGRKVTLFGGAFGSSILGAIGGFHLLTDVALEFLAIWVPATIAFAAWGVAASDAVRAVVTHMQDLHTVSDATGKTIAPMTGALEKMHQAVQPAVYQLFGDALTIMNNKTGLFQELVRATNPVITQLAARLTVATVNAQKFGSKLLGAGPSDLAKLGDSFASVFGIIGNILKNVPGYAEILLNLGAAILHVAEVISQWAQPLIRAGLVLHGFIVYVGLAVTAVALLGPALLGLAAWAGGVIVELIALGIEMAAVATESGVLAGAMVLIDAAGGPFLWIAGAVAALTVLTVWLLRSKDATQRWTDSLQAQITAAPTVAAGTRAIASAQISVSNALGAASARLANTQQYLNTVNLHTGQSMQVLNPAYRQAAQRVDDLRAATTVLSDQQNLSTFRMNALSKTYGGQATAMGLVNAAGITEKEWLTKTPEQWAIIRQQVAATAQGYQAMGQTGTSLSNDMEVLDRQATDQYKAMQKLNGAWDTFIANATGTQLSFDTYALGLNTLSSSATKASTSLGGAHMAIGPLGKAVDGLTSKDLALNQAFSTQVQNSNALIDTWRTAGISSNQFARGVKDIIAPLTKYAQGSHEATSQLVALAQEAGYRGPDSLKTLTKWLGNTHDATATVKRITNEATSQEALLTSAMQAQGSYIANTLIGDINSAILKYDGVYQAATNYGNAIARSGRQSDAAKSARKTLINDLIASGKAAGDSTGQIASMISKVLHIPKRAALKLILSAEASGKITLAEQMLGKNAKGYLEFHARGALIGPGYGGGDKHLAMLEAGETVVPKHLTPAVAPLMHAHHVPGFETGGLIGSGQNDLVYNGSRSMWTGQWVIDRRNDFDNQFAPLAEELMKSGVQAAVQAVQAAVAASASSYPGGGSSGPGAAAAQRYASSILHLYGWSQGQMPPLISLWNQESGWNYRALNPGSGAYGIPQSLPADKMAAAGSDWRTNPATQIRWGLGYIRSTYGSPAGAWAHEQQFNWYGDGLDAIVNRPTIIGVGEHGPEHVQVTPLGQADAAAALLEAQNETNDLLDELIATVAASSSSTGEALGRALNQTARKAGRTGSHSTRG